MNREYPNFIEGTLQPDEHVVFAMPEPDRRGRIHSLVKLAPIFALFFVTAALVAKGDTRMGLYESLVGVAAIGGAVIFLVLWLRHCRTSYVVTSKRAIRLVSDRVAEEVNLSDCHPPNVISFAQSPSILLRSVARVLRVSSFIVLRRKSPLPLTLKRFLLNINCREMMLGTALMDLDIQRTFEKAQSAWEAAQ